MPSLPHPTELTPFIKVLFDHPEVLKMVLDLENKNDNDRKEDLFYISHRLGSLRAPLPSIFPQLTNPVVLRSLIKELKLVDWPTP
jgi:hypothetical protein